MSKNLETLEAVHTHTHTDILLDNGFQKISCKCGIAGINFDEKNKYKNGS